MVNKLLFSKLVLFFLLCIPQGAAAQFAPGKKPKEGVAVEYAKIKDDTLMVRKSKLEPKKSSSKGVVLKADSLNKKGSALKKNVSVAAKAKPSKSKTAKVDSVKYATVTYRLGDRIIMRGDSGADVRNVARILVNKLYMDEDSIIYTNGNNVLYDGELVKAVMRFQRLNGFYEDGIIGYEIIKALRKRK